jgi:hypothetical protein
MDPWRPVRTNLWAARLLPLLLIFSLGGCSSIQSKSVRTLIDIEAERIAAAGKNSEELIPATHRATDAWEKSIRALDRSLESQKRIESAHGLIFSANQNIAAKTGADAAAAGYLVGEIYLAERTGLEQAVLDQFDQDFKALKKLAEQINKSWAALKKTQNEVRAFASRSSLAAVDADLARALVVEFAVDSEAIDTALRRSRQVNDALKKAQGLGLAGKTDSGRAPAALQDFIRLLSSVK